MQALRRLVALVGAAMIACTGVAFADPEAHVAPPGVAGDIVERRGDGLVPTIRYVGANRYDTANLIATDAEPEAAMAAGVADFLDADEVLVARGDAFPDALAATYLAGVVDGPILLTPSGGLDPATREALDTIDPETVTVLGGPQAIADAVLAELGQDFRTRRIGGADRYETAVLLAREGGTYGDVDGARTAIVAAGQNYPDALVTGPLAYGANLPLLLSGQGSLDPRSGQALTDLGIERVIVPGGVVALDANVESQIAGLGIDVVRLSGANRVETAVEVARFATAELDGFTADHLNLARGDEFPDSLALGPHAGAEGAPVLLAAGPADLDGPTSAVADYLGESVCDPRSIHLAGGVQALSADLEQDLRAAATHSGGACLVSLTVQSTAGLGENVDVAVTVTDNGGEAAAGPNTVTFTVTSTDGATPVPASGEVTTDANGRATFDFTSATPGTAVVAACITDEDGQRTCTTRAVTFGGGGAGADADGDGVVNTPDNCPGIPNTDQADGDGDGIGDVCDDDVGAGPAATDTDADGVANADDNCPGIANADQADADGDGPGDACDADDADGDAVADNADNCPGIPNVDQADTNGDGAGDACDVVFFGLTGNNLLVRSDASRDLTVVMPVLLPQETALITGVNPGTLLVGLDRRPSTGVLYALGTDGQLYTVAFIQDAVTGALLTANAAPVGAPSAFGATLTDGVGFDFNPALDLLRVVVNTGENFSVDPTTGAATAQTPLSRAPGDPNAGTPPAVTAAAYDAAATLFDLDTGVDALVTQTPPASGVLATVGPLGLDALEFNGFDIAANGLGYAAVVTPDEAADSGLYLVDLATGATTEAGLLTGAFQGLTVATG